MSRLTITDITPAFGAQVEGIDPATRLSDEDEHLLRELFDERGLLLCRGLAGLPPAYQHYLASTVIGMEGAAGEGEKDDDAAYFVSNARAGGGAPYGRLLFHSDMMWAEAPFQVLTLFAVEVEPPVVPTTFTSASAAWSSLPSELRTRINGLHAIHATGQQTRAEEAGGDLLQPVREQVRTSMKPIANLHPRTGRTILYVSEMMTSEIEELPEPESEELLGRLFRHLYDPAILWTHEWQSGDLVIWDNLSIQHARGNVDAEGPVRTLRKVIAPRVSRAQRPESPRFDTVG